MKKKFTTDEKAIEIAYLKGKIEMYEYLSADFFERWFYLKEERPRVEYFKAKERLEELTTTR